jgi:PIN domain nuclease of toxin-antitoxin system
VRLLLDTHALLWFVDGDANLFGAARAAIEAPANAVLVSAASVWEIATKHRLAS